MIKADASKKVRIRYWVILLIRGALALIPAIVITFTQVHSVLLGTVVFGIWAILSGGIVGPLLLQVAARRRDRVMIFIAAIVTAAAGIFALTLPADLTMLRVVVGIWALITGPLELAAGLLHKDALGRDQKKLGALTTLLVIPVALLTADAVGTVGFLSVYLIILGVFLVIAAFSHRTSATPARKAVVNIVEGELP